MEMIASLIGAVVGWSLGLATPFFSRCLMVRIRGPRLQLQCVPLETETGKPGTPQFLSAFE